MTDCEQAEIEGQRNRETDTNTCWQLMRLVVNRPAAQSVLGEMTQHASTDEYTAVVAEAESAWLAGFAGQRL